MAEEDKEVSLSETISAAFDESDKTDEQSSAPDRDEANDQSDIKDQEADKDQPDAEDKSGKKDTGDQDGKDEGQPETVNPPAHWSAADKEAFKGATKDVQEWALRREKEMTADYTRKTQDIANFRRTWDPVHQMFAPHIQQGANPASIIQGWAQVAQHLQQNPAQALQQLARQYNIDMSSLTQGEKPDNDDLFVDPRVAQMQQQLQQLQSHLQSRDQAELHTRQRSYENEIQSFAEQKTEAGEAAHPFFDDVMQDMMTLARAQIASGQQPKLQDLYEKAVWSNPLIRERQLAAQQQAAAKIAEKEAIEKAKKAQKASKSVGGSAPGEPAKDMSIRESLESLM